MVNILGDDLSVKPHYTIDSLTISGKRKFINIEDEENFRNTYEENNEIASLSK